MSDSTLELSPTVARWAQEMQRELDANKHKGGDMSWADCLPEEVWADMGYHGSKLIYAIKHREHDKVREFAADVANMACMVADAYNRLYVPDPVTLTAEVEVPRKTPRDGILERIEGRKGSVFYFEAFERWARVYAETDQEARDAAMQFVNEEKDKVYPSLLEDGWVVL